MLTESYKQLLPHSKGEGMNPLDVGRVISPVAADELDSSKGFGEFGVFDLQQSVPLALPKATFDSSRLGDQPRSPVTRTKSNVKKRAVQRLQSLVNDGKHAAHKKTKDRFEVVNQHFLDSITQVFHAFDEDGNGRIDRSELLDVLRSMGYDLDGNVLTEMLAELGYDQREQSTGLNITEFRLLIRLWMTTAQYKVFHKATHREGPNNKFTAVLNDAYWRWPWFLLLYVATAYFWFSTFASYMWVPESIGDVLRLLMPYDIVVTLVLLFEMFLRFRIGFVKNDRFCDDDNEIRKHYLGGWFAFDLATSFPWHLLLLSVPLASFALRHLRLLLIFRTASWMAPSRQIPMSGKYIHFHYHFLPNAELLLGLVGVVFACGMIHYSIASDYPRFADENSVCSIRPPRSFTSSIYWSMYCISSIGLGDLNPVTSEERWLYSFVCLLSLVVNGYFVGSIVTRLQEADVKQNIQNRLVQLQAVLNFFDVPKALETEILQFEDHTLRHNVILTYQDVVDMLPPEMRQNMAIYSRVPLLQNVKLFSDVHSSTLIRLATTLHPITSAPEQYVAMSDEENVSLFIITYGFVDVLEANGQYVATINRGSSFGERGLLCEGQYFTQSFKALTYCDLYALERDEFWEICDEHPKFGLKMKSLGEKFEVFDIPAPRKVHPHPAARRNSVPIAEFLPATIAMQKRVWRPSVQLAGNGFIVEETEALPAGCIFYSGPSANRTIRSVREASDGEGPESPKDRNTRARRKSSLVSIERVRRPSQMQLPHSTRAESVQFETDDLLQQSCRTDSPSSVSPGTSFLYADMSEDALWTTLLEEMEQVRQLTAALCGGSIRRSAVKLPPS